jgi:hypothetical protein
MADDEGKRGKFDASDLLLLRIMKEENSKSVPDHESDNLKKHRHDDHDGVGGPGSGSGSGSGSGIGVH